MSGPAMPGPTSAVPDEGWARLTKSLKAWMLAFRDATTSHQPRKVLSLMQGLVGFMSSSHGAFVDTLMKSADIDGDLKSQGAPQSFIDTFMSVLNVMGSNTPRSPRVLTFGPHKRLKAHEIDALMARFAEALLSPAASPLASPRARSASPTRALPEATTAVPPASVPRSVQQEVNDMTIALHGESGHDVEAVRSIELSRMSDAVAIAASALPPDVVQGLSEHSAVPFIFFRHLNSFFVEVLFCVQYGEITFVIGRKIIYCGPGKGRQLEAACLSLPSSDNAQALLAGPQALPWQSAMQMLEAGDGDGEQDAEHSTGRERLRVQDMD